jgi:trans-aconitate 2-methyltransferase
MTVSVGRASGGPEPSVSPVSPGSAESAAGAPASAVPWEPDSYLRFADHRIRPILDLIEHVPARAPRLVADLGCGPGNATELFSDRWPGARVLGVDSSAEMIASAAVRARSGRLDFVQADLRTWRPPEPVDVLISNATLQWIPGHLGLIPRLLGLVAPGGWFAFTVPGNFAAPSHTLLADLQGDARWSGRFTGEHVRPRSHEPAEYLRTLIEAGGDAQVEVWEATYYHVLEGPDGALDYARPTILRPVLAELGGPESQDARAFVAEYAAALRIAYPPTELGGRTVQVMPYRRLFAIARMASS